MGTVAVIGDGAAGTLAAIHLVAGAGRDESFDLVVLGPAGHLGRGVAYSTSDPRHLLNVRAGAMSALPERPDHFVEWLRRGALPGAAAADFVARSLYGPYLAATFLDLLAATDRVRLEHRRCRVVALRSGVGAGDSVLLDLDDGTALAVAAAVLAPGIFAPGTDWAPQTLRTSSRFVADPWTPGALDAAAAEDVDVLLVGTGLTTFDVVASLDRPGRTLHAVSRRGRLPQAHTTRRVNAAAELPADVVDLVAGRAPVDLGALRALVADTVRATVRDVGDWRPGFDALRPVTADLWGRLCVEDRAELLRTDAAWWDLHRHRMPPDAAAAVSRLRSAGRLHVGTDEVLAVAEDGDVLRVTLASGRTLTVGWVVNCTGPLGDVRRAGDPLLDNVLASGVATAGPLGLGLATHDGRLVDATGSTALPVWTLGSMRRGELWESTAVPEIRAQAEDVAAAIREELSHGYRAAAEVRSSAAGTYGAAGSEACSATRRRTGAADLMGLPLSTTPEAAAAFNRGLDAVMHVRSGAVDAFSEAVTADPYFALGHGALAMLGHEGGASVDVRSSLESARRSVRRRGTDRERSLVGVIDARVRDCRGAGADALVRHVHEHPTDVLAVSAAVPTIAFSGVTDIQQEAWALVEGLAPSYGDHWWYASILSFVRQDQGRYDDAALLADRVLGAEPASGHAVHARTHVYYETGAHDAGLRWLDPWITTCGRQATHRAHYSWHAALHELSTGDCAAVRRRYAEQLAPPLVTGVRGLVDSASLLWRCQVTGAWPGPVPVGDVLAHAGDELVERPGTPFTAFHSAVALTAAGDATRLVRLERHTAAATDPVLRDVVAPLCAGLLAVVEHRFDDAVARLRSVLTPLVRVGGSAAQREVVEETLLHCLVAAGRCDEARVLIDARLDRRPSPLDVRRRERV